jgi:hypothetical protein
MLGVGGRVMHGRRQTLLVSLLGGVLLLCALAGPAVAEDASQLPDGFEQTFDPSLTEAVPDTAPVEDPSDEPIDTDAAENTADNEPSNETVQQPGWGSAADQTSQAKRAEAGFRLFDGNRVQAVAETGKMRASSYRYACER